MKKPRKAYKPKGMNRDPTNAARTMQALMTTGQLKLIVVPMKDACKVLGTTFDIDDWRNLADASNVARELKGMGIASGPQADEVFSAFHDALVALHERHGERGTWTPRASELQAVRDGVWLHEFQLKHCSMLEFQNAWQAVVRKSRDAHIKGHAADVVKARAAAREAVAA
jgi:hypothetical protein